MTDALATTEQRRRLPRSRTKILALLALAAIVVFAITRPASNVQFQPSGPAKATPPAAQLTEMTADDFEDVLVGLRGRPVIVNIWASWCAPCRTETPLLERAWAANSGDVAILGVASKDVASSSRSFMREFDVGYPNIFDTTGDIRARLGLRGFPTTYAFDRNGKLRTTIVGGLTEPRLAVLLQDLRT